MNLFFSGLLEKEDMKKLLEETGAGLETIQFSVSENLDHFSQTLRKEKEILTYFDNPRLTIHGPFLDLNPMSYDSRVQQVTMNRFNQAYEAAAILGAKKVIYHSGMIPTVYYLQGWADRMANFWNRFMEDKPASGGVTVCMENVLDRKAEPFLDVCRQVTHPDFGVCLDVGHAYCYGEDKPEKWIRLLAGRIRHVHVHDNDGVNDLHLAVGSGTIDWGTVLPELKDGNPDMTWTIECADTTAARKSWEYLRRY